MADQVPKTVDLDAFIEREGEGLARAMKERRDLVPELLRFQLLTEAQFERMIQFHLPRGDRVIEHGGLSYIQKLEVVNAFGVLSDSVVRSLRNLDKLRVRYAGQVDASVSMADIGTVGRALGPTFTQAKFEADTDVERLVNSTFGLIYGYLVRAVYLIEHPGHQTVLDKLADVASRER